MYELKPAFNGVMNWFDIFIIITIMPKTREWLMACHERLIGYGKQQSAAILGCIRIF